MVKKSHRQGENDSKIGNFHGETVVPFLVGKAPVDPSLADLFASSAGPVKAPSRIRYEQQPSSSAAQLTTSIRVEESSNSQDGSLEGDDEELTSLDKEPDDSSATSLPGDIASFLSSTKPLAGFNPIEAVTSAQSHPRKRKRSNIEDDVEGKYMLRLAREEEKEDEARQTNSYLKRQKLAVEQVLEISHKDPKSYESDDSHDSINLKDTQVSTDPLDIPQHETLRPNKDATELEKSSRTAFLANVSTAAITEKKAKKALLDHLSSFLDSLPVREGQKKHILESIRFRSTAYAGNGLPKKAAFATKNLMGATTKSTNAYVVYSTAFAAREAVKKLNGTVVLDRHLRVDGVAHPAKTDHRRCVFVGNLGFVDDESMMDQAEGNERKRSKIPSDVEEGLWRQFSKAGTVESVRVIRDEKTRVGKGFAYVQFQDANSVEAALLFHEKKYPPMLPRVLRVTRAKAINKTALASQHSHPSSRPSLIGSTNPNRERIYNPKLSGQRQSLQGRAAKLLGRAGAARFRGVGKAASEESRPPKRLQGITKPPESIVFEGYRASQKSGKPKDLKVGGSGGGKKKGKPRIRSSKRASDWKKGGGKKMK